MTIAKVVRVGTLNNFNCTDEEFNQLYDFTDKYPDNYFFVNCNINTPQLVNINNHPFKVVITLNPNINEHLLYKLRDINLNRVAFFRLKYVPNNENVLSLLRTVSQFGIPIVITNQRFNGKVSVAPYGIENYKYSCSRYRLTDKAFSELKSLTKEYTQVYICDESGGGCKSCGLCCSLTTGYCDITISSLNLSTSGVCPYNCIDCYAKTIQKFVVACGHNQVDFDKIKMNMKQKGTTSHTKNKGSV